MRRRVMIVVLAALAVWQLASAAYIPVKAWLAQQLLEQAWEDGQRRGQPMPPWPWADIRPVARLKAPTQGVSLIVLAGTSGAALAFGPGHLTVSAAPGTNGNTVLSAHRDTHFRFLREVTIGQRLELESLTGGSTRYRVVHTEVVDVRQAQVRLDSPTPRLTLITCWPFDALRPGGPQRFVVTAEAVEAQL